MTAAEIRARLPPGLSHEPLALAANRPAAVLVPIEPERGVWLTKRSQDLIHHAGQVAFPGGKIESFDGSVAAAALREAQEEIGLRPDDAEILGRMDDFVTGTGFHIAPVVALLPSGVTFSPAAAEVQEIFCLPFERLLDPDAPRRRRAVLRGIERDIWVWPHDEHVIWGATAAILRMLAARLGAVA